MADKILVIISMLGMIAFCGTVVYFVAEPDLLVVTVLVLLPLLALAGALGPGMIVLGESREDGALPADDHVLEFVPRPAYRRPMLLQREFSTGLLTEAVDLDADGPGLDAPGGGGRGDGEHREERRDRARRSRAAGERALIG